MASEIHRLMYGIIVQEKLLFNISESSLGTMRPSSDESD